MRVMWFSINGSMFELERFSGGWVSSLEQAMYNSFGEKMNLAVVFETINDLPEKIEKNKTIYYPIKKQRVLRSILKSRVNAYNNWNNIKQSFIKAVNDFQPDIIHCFGSEWTYGMIVEDVSIPVVIHMQGFLNIYYPSVRMNIKEKCKWQNVLDIRYLISRMIVKRWEESCMRLERKIMSSNSYFMGRTEWDNMIVRHYSPGSHYFHVPELLRPLFHKNAGSWRYKSGQKIRILTVSQADFRKGIDMTLYVCRILRELTDLAFEWRIAGNRDYLEDAEKRTGIKCSEVGINFLGHIPEEQIIQELQEATLFIHPSLIDNSPNSICEAQIIGCPVIATNVGGVGSLVKNGETGFLYPYNEPHTLAFRIADLGKNASLLTKVSENEVHTALARHNPTIVAERVWNVYQEIISDYRKIC